jgi:hypothetical protein
LKAQQGFGRISLLLKPSQNEAQLRACKDELQHALENFRVRMSVINNMTSDPDQVFYGCGSE